MAVITKIPATADQALKALEQIAKSSPVVAAAATDGTNIVDEGKARSYVNSFSKGRLAGAMFAPKATVEPNYDAMAAFIDSLPTEMRAEVLNQIVQKSFGGGQ